MRINTNVASLTAQEASINTNKALSSSLEKLGSGLRINKASDDASGLAIADKLRTQASSLGQGISNANSASALIQIADKAMAEQSNILDTVKQKLIQASTSTTNADGREAIRKDVNKLLTQFDNIAAQTNYNGTTLLQKSATDTAKPDTFSFQLGEDKDFDVSTTLSKASNTSDLGGGSDDWTTNDNVAVAGSQQFKTSVSTVLKDTNVDVDGADTDGTLGLDFDVSGKIGTVVVEDASTFDASNQTQAIKEAMDLLVASNTQFSDADSDNVYSLAAGQSVAFGDLDFSGMQVDGGAADKSIKLNDDGADVIFSISNNNATATAPLKGQINVANAAATGGSLLSDIKELAADGLTAAKANE